MVPFRPFLSNLSCKKLKPFAPIVRLVIFVLDVDIVVKATLKVVVDVDGVVLAFGL